MEFMIGMILFGVALLIIVIDSLVNFGSLEGIHFGKTASKRKRNLCTTMIERLTGAMENKVMQIFYLSRREERT